MINKNKIEIIEFIFLTIVYSYFLFKMLEKYSNDNNLSSLLWNYQTNTIIILSIIIIIFISIILSILSIMIGLYFF